MNESEAERAIRIEELYKKWAIQRAENQRLRVERQQRLEEKARERAAADARAAIERRKRIAALTIKLKFVFRMLGYILAAAGIVVGAWLLYLLVKWAITWSWNVIFVKAGWVLLIAGCLAVAAGTMYCFVRLIKWLYCKFGDNCIPCIDRQNKIADAIIRFIKFVTPFFVAIGTGIMWVVNGITEIWDIIMTIKKNNCPGIEWRDDA